MTLTFNLTPRPGFAAVTVIGPDGSSWQDGAAVVAGNSVTQAVRPLGPAGRYTVGFRIVSSDGHPVQGSTGFILTAAGPGAATESTPSAAAPPPAVAEPDGPPAWPWILGGAALLAAGAVVALRFGRS